jgi:uncharacterized protein (DUF2164 family)
VIATHGRSFYVLDGIDLLRQATPEVLSRRVHLFMPEAVIRPLRPAVVDYYLAEPASKAVLEILDSQDKVVRSFDSTIATSGGAELQGTTIGTSPLSARAGTNRFEWDLRYPGSTVFPGIVLRYAVPGEGPVAPPGNYSVRLTANGVTQTQPLVIRRDPRLTETTDADLQEEFKLAIEIRDALSRAHEGVIRIRSLDTQMASSAAEAKNPGISQAAALIKSKLDEIESDLYQVKNRSPRDTLNYPIKLNNQLAVLQRLVDTGEFRPTDQDYAVFLELTQRLNEMLARLDQVVATDLKQLNDQLAARNVKVVTAK